jgi:hypothetical protein
MRGEGNIKNFVNFEEMAADLVLEKRGTRDLG